MASASDLPDGVPVSKKASVFSAEWMAAHKAEWVEKEAREQARHQEKMKDVNPEDYPLWINPEPEKNYSNEKDPKVCEKRMDEIKAMLDCMGVSPVASRYGISTGNCVAAAIFNGYIKITGDPKELDMIVYADVGEGECDHVIFMTLRDLLLQPDCCAGDDPTDGCERVTVRCTHEYTEDEIDPEDPYPQSRCDGREYVSRICTGYPRFDCYEHSHCPGCLNFGNCKSSIESAHCGDCGKHYSYRFEAVCECKKDPADEYRGIITSIHFEIATEEEVEMIYQGMKGRGELTKDIEKMKDEHLEKEDCAACERVVKALQVLGRTEYLLL